MLKIINIINLITLFAVAQVHAMEINTVEKEAFPASWEEFVGKKNLGMLFDGNSTVYGIIKRYVIKVADDTSMFETIENPEEPEKFQKYRLTPQGLEFELQFKNRHLQGVLNIFIKQETSNEIIWIFKGHYDNGKEVKEVTHRFAIQKNSGALVITTYFGDHVHAEVKATPKSKSEFNSKYIFSKTYDFFFGK